MADEILGHTPEEWEPMPINMGPPLPRFLNIYWPWYEKEEVPGVFTCPYCGATFSTQEELNQHILTAHPTAPPVADIRVENLLIAKSQVAVDEANTITVTAKNYGGASGSKTITCSVDGINSTQTVTLNPGESEAVSFTITPHEAKTYSISVDGLTGSFTATQVAPAQFVYASDIRQTPWTPYPQYPARQGMKYEVDIQNIGGIAGSCTAVGYVDTSAQKTTFQMGTQAINPGQVVTFKGQWEWGFVPEEDDWWIKDGGYIVSEAGYISYKFGRSVYLVSFDIPAQIASGGEFWPTQIVHLAGGGVRPGSLPPNASPNLEGDLFMLGLTLTGIISEYLTRENAVISRCNINALHYVTQVLLSDGGKSPMGDMQLLTTYSDYTVKGTYKMQILVEHNGGGVVVSVNVPCKAIYMLPGPIGNYGPIPPGTYDVISTLGWSYQQTGYAPWHVRPIWSYKVGQLKIV